MYRWRCRYTDDRYRVIFIGDSTVFEYESLKAYRDNIVKFDPSPITQTLVLECWHKTTNYMLPLGH